MRQAGLGSAINFALPPVGTALLWSGKISAVRLVAERPFRECISNRSRRGTPHARSKDDMIGAGS